MDYQSWIEGINGKASLYSFDILPDGQYSEIRLMAVNRASEGMILMNPDAPVFYPGIPYRTYWMDLNFENFIYKSAETLEPLYSYVNARGVWLKGFYIPISDIWDEEPKEQKPDGTRTFFCLYVVHFEEQAKAESMLKRSTEVSNAVLDIGIKLHESNDFYQSMGEVVSSIMDFCGAEMCSIYTVDKASQECIFINNDGVQKQIMDDLSSEMGRTPIEIAKAWEKDLALSDCLILDDLSVIEERDPVWYKSMKRHGIYNIVLFAIRHNHELVGFIWGANFDVNRRRRIKETLELTTFLLAAGIANHQLLSKLEIKSTVDSLTQIGNRNAMAELILEFEKGDKERLKNLGVVFIDLNGLKKINDQKGHSAGDKLLIRASSIIKAVYSDDHIFRAGGDEFVIFCPNTTEEIIAEKVTQLKKMADATSDVSFAGGSVYSNGEYDINYIIKTADERMYQDKKAFYSSNPEKTEEFRK